MIVNIFPNLKPPLEVEIQGGSPTKHVDESIELTAHVSSIEEELAYSWYVNGAAEETGDTYMFDSSWPVGYYVIEVTVFRSDDGSQAGSTTQEIEVIE